MVLTYERSKDYVMTVSVGTSRARYLPLFTSPHPFVPYSTTHLYAASIHQDGQTLPQFYVAPTGRAI